MVLAACSALLPEQQTRLMPDCNPIDPQAAVLPDRPCFEAILVARNTVELRWRVQNSTERVYLLDDVGPVLRDPGYRPAVCDTDAHGACATRFNVATGGSYRWLLQVSHADGSQLHVPAKLGVPPLLPPANIDGGGFVDMLSPQAQTLTWSGATGNAPKDTPRDQAWIELRSPGLTEPREKQPRFGSDAQLDIPAAVLAGQTRLIVQARECLAPQHGELPLCSGRRTTGFRLAADHFLHPNPLYIDSGEDLTLRFTARSGDERRLRSATLLPQGPLATSSDELLLKAQKLSPGSHNVTLSSCLLENGKCSPEKSLHILVDSPVQWTLDRDYRLDFFPGTARPIEAGGGPLDITFDAQGGTWMINEFANSVEHVSAAGVAESLSIPLARVKRDDPKQEAPTRRHIVGPFSSGLMPRDTPAQMSELAERATWDGSRVWFTQGGGVVRGGGLETPNHSRIIAANPAAQNDPRTPWDDRLCVYNMPDDGRAHGNNQIIGLASGAGRIWVAESRGYLIGQASAISSFVPDPDDCDPWLDFSTPGALDRQRLQYCAVGESPETHGCVEKVLLDAYPEGPGIAHLAMDPDGRGLWFTDALGQFLGHLDPGAGNDVTLYPLPANQLDASLLTSLFRGFPWSIRVDDEAVYIGEFLATDLLRFDKASRSFSEIHVPVASDQMSLHSIDIDAASDRLWFTLSMEHRLPQARSKSTIGYIDLASWRRHAERGDSEPVTGVIYTGLDSIPASIYNPGQPQNFRGIAVEASSGKLALATTYRGQTTLLVPRPAFRQAD